jgi:transcriptional regulator with XRE-family HTH domain
MQDMTALRETERGWIPSANSFGARLALVRNHLGLNAKAAAERAGVDDSSWLAWETKGTKPRDLVEKARQISDTLGCDFIWLLTGSSEGGKSTERYRAPYGSLGGTGVVSVTLGATGFIPAA